MFLANARILAEAINEERNTACYNFRSHGFTTSSGKQYHHLLVDCRDIRFWKLVSHPLLHRDSLEVDQPRLAWHKPVPNPERRQNWKRGASTAAPAVPGDDASEENPFLLFLQQNDSNFSGAWDFPSFAW
jgi:hypothetical protein